MKKRVMSAIIMILLFIPITIAGQIPFLILMTVLGLLGLSELLSAEKYIPYCVKISSYLWYCLILFFNYFNMDKNILLNWRLLLVMILFYFSMIVIIGDIKKYNYKNALIIIGEIVIMSIVFVGLLNIRNNNIIYIFYLFLISSLTDTFALFSGKLFGHHKLIKCLSPNKTIEGFIGGLLGGALISSLFYLIALNIWEHWLYTLLISVFLSILGQIGDLFFSSIKRQYSIKDFSNLIPGHGGILDRLDSAIFVILGFILIYL